MSAPQAYRFVSHRLNQTNVQGQLTSVGSEMEYTVTVTWPDTASNRTIRFSADSMHRADGEMFALTGATRDISGTTLSAPVDERGAIGEFIVDPEDHLSNPVLGQLAAVLVQFFPRIPAEGVMPGTTWSDTTAFDRNQQGADITVEAMTEFHAAHWSDTTDARVLVVSWSREFTVSGSGEQMGQTFTIDGTGISHGRHRFGSDGVYLGTVVRDSSESHLTISSLGMSLPLFQVGADTIQLARIP